MHLRDVRRRHAREADDDARLRVVGDEPEAARVVEGAGDAARRVLADVERREAVALDVAGGVLDLTFRGHGAGDVEDDLDVDAAPLGTAGRAHLDHGFAAAEVDEAQVEGVRGGGHGAELVDDGRHGGFALGCPPLR